jgi:uncharacterized membrane protein YcaP (DUF421 family)
MLFHGWEPLLRTLIVGTLAYLGLVVLLRISGKRTLSKWNAFDFVVTVAFGSVLATLLLSRDTALAEGLLALALLVLLQGVITFLSSRSRRVEQIVKAKPTLLLYSGRMIDSALADQRVTREEVLAAVRSSGHVAVEEIAAVVLETDGSFSVMASVEGGSDSALEGVDGYEEAARRQGDAAGGRSTPG